MRLLCTALLLVSTCLWSAIDPTSPPEFRQTQAAASNTNINEMKVTAIFSFPGNHSAIINGQAMRVGDTINGVKVLTIKPGTVTVENELGEMKILHLFKPLS